MTLVLAGALVLPLAAAAVLAGLVVTSRPAVPAALLAATAGWTVVATEPVSHLGPVRPDVLGAVTAAGVVAALFAVVERTRADVLTSAAVAAGGGVLAALAALGREPEQPFAPTRAPSSASLVAFAVAGLGLAVFVAVRRAGLADTALASIGGLGAVVAAVLSDGDPARPAALLASAVGLAAAAAGLRRADRAPALVLLAVVGAVAARVTAAGVDVDGGRATSVLLAVLALVAAGHGWWRGAGPAAAAAPVALFGGALTVAAEPTGSRAAGLLVLAAAVLIASADHVVSWASAWPGASAALTVLGRSDEPEGAFLVAVGAVVATVIVLTHRGEVARPPAAPALPAVVFALVPAAWSWARAPGLDDAGRSIGLVIAAVGVGAGFGALVHLRRDGSAAQGADTLLGPVGPDSGELTDSS